MAPSLPTARLAQVCFILIGKTYTMMGDVENDETKGLTPRIVQNLFEHICNSSSDLEFTVKVSFMEIYMEKVKDLLNRNS